jgi:putative aminopeptidase FrvX
MLKPAAVTFLKKLLDTPGPSGYESAAAKAWRDEAGTFAAEVHSDVHGNSMAVVNPQGAPTIMLAGHIDEIGVIVTYIDDDGYVYIAPIGGWDPQVLVAQRIRFLGRDGDVLGAVGKKPIHLMKPEDREKASKMTDLWVDIGASTRAQAEARLSIGDAGVIDSRTLDFPNDRIVSRSIDDRIGAFVVLEALRVAGERVAPAMAIVVDVTFATDHPGIEKKELGDSKLGSGPVLTRGSVVSPVAFRILRDTAELKRIPFTLHAAGRETSTDADAIHLAREGVATALLSVPNRYMHSPNEMVSLVDLDHAATLIAASCKAVTGATDFTAR